MTDIFDVINTLKGSVDGRIKDLRKTALTTEVSGLVIDTCNTVDAGWETGVMRKPEGRWKIIEYYEGPEQAKIGHERWVKAFTANPELDVPNAQEMEIISQDSIIRILEEKEEGNV